MIIDTHIPPPKKCRPIKKNELLIELNSTILLEGLSINQIRTTICNVSKQYGYKYKCRTTNKGVRVTRIK